MIAYMSSKSRIYHRDGCRYTKSIGEQLLTAFDTEDRITANLRPCKCCCTMKAVYNSYKPRLGVTFRDMNVETVLDGQCVNVYTAWYNWRLCLNLTTQNIELYQEVMDEESQEIRMVRCDKPAATDHIAPVMGYIASEERLAPYPEVYRKYALQIEKLAKDNNLQIEFDNTDLYILTDIAAWKIAYGYFKDSYKLLHSPFDGSALTMEEAKSAHYHVQADVSRRQSPYKHLQYIIRHDAAKKIEQIDYRLLPRATKRQKKYYNQAVNREKRRSIRRVYDLFAELEAKEEFAKVSFA